VSQLLVEACVLGTLGALGGLLVARATLSVMRALLPAQRSAMIDTALALPVLLFAGGLALATAFIFGLVPALQSTRVDLARALHDQAGRTYGTPAAARFRTTLATAQVALSMMLLVCAGLFTRSLSNISRVDLGLRTERMLTFAISPELNGYRPEQSRALFERLEEELRALPGVSAVTSALIPPLSGSNWGNDVSVEGFHADPDTDTNARFNSVGPGYLSTLGMVLLAGREFERRDALGSAKVAIVNEAFARKFNLGTAVVGKHMGLERGGALTLEIVGLARDAHYSEVKQVPPPQYFIPYRQDENVGSLSFYVRTTVDSPALLAAIPALVRRLDPNLPVEDLRPMALQVRENTALDRLVTIMSLAFASLATLLAGIGLYGVLAFTLTQRTRELGVRMALGADPGRIRGLVLAQVARMSLVGGALGLVAALGLGRAAGALLFGLESHDPLTLLGAALTLALVALAAGAIPALRAARLDPLLALRHE
jgi:predicted permease